MTDVLSVIEELSQKDGAVSLRLRTVGRNGAPPVLGPDGAPLAPVRVDLPLQSASVDQLRRWLEDAQAAEWPAGRSLRVEVEDGAQTAFASKTVSAPVITGRPTVSTVERPPWVEPPARAIPAAAPAPQLLLDASSPNLALLQSLQHAHQVFAEFARDSLNACVGLADRNTAANSATLRETVGQLGQSVRAGLGQVDRLANVVGKIAEAEHERNDKLHRQVVAKTEEVGEAAAQALTLEQALQTAGNVVQKSDPIDKLAALAPLLTALNQPRRPAPAQAQVEAQPAPAVEPLPVPGVDASTLQAARRGDASARAQVRAILQAGGGLDGLAWLVQPEDG